MLIVVRGWGAIFMDLHNIINFFTFSRIKRHIYVVKFSVLAICSYLFATFTSNEVIRPLFKVEEKRLERKKRREVKIKRSRARDYYEIILDRNIFDSTDKPVPGSSRAGGKSGSGSSLDLTGPSVKTTLPLKLIGTMVLDNPKWSLSIITGDSKSKSNAYMVNDIVLSSAVIVKILRNKVLLKNNGRLEHLEIKEDQPAFIAERKAGDIGVKSSGEGKFVVNRRELNQAFADLSTILTQARVVPHFKDGKTVGFRIFAIQPGSIYTKLGLKNNDIIARVNGVLIDDPTKGLQLFNALKTESKIELDIERTGVKRSLKYDIK